MSICLLVIDDGREDYLERCLTSLGNSHFDSEVVVRDPEHRLGFAGAIQAGWDRVIATGREYVFHVESDFIFLGDPPLNGMSALLSSRPEIVQVALKRQSWNEREKAAGGIVEADLDAFEERWEGGIPYTVHRRFFTTNPSLYRVATCHRGWPQESESEGKFGIALFKEHHATVSAFWGAKFDPPRVEHIGKARAGCGY